MLTQLPQFRPFAFDSFPQLQAHTSPNLVDIFCLSALIPRHRQRVLQVQAVVMGRCSVRSCAFCKAGAIGEDTYCQL